MWQKAVLWTLVLRSRVNFANNYRAASLSDRSGATDWLCVCYCVCVCVCVCVNTHQLAKGTKLDKGKERLTWRRNKHRMAYIVLLLLLLLLLMMMMMKCDVRNYAHERTVSVSTLRTRGIYESTLKKCGVNSDYLRIRWWPAHCFIIIIIIIIIINCNWVVTRWQYTITHKQYILQNNKNA